jgi:hypothetical protein
VDVQADQILRHLQCLRKENPPLTVDHIVALFFFFKTPLVSTTPARGGSAAHVPLLISEYDLNNFCHIVLPESQYDLFMSHSESNLPRLKATLVQPLRTWALNATKQVTPNVQLPLLGAPDFGFSRKFFADEEIVKYEQEWTNGVISTRDGSKKAELFVRSKEAEKLSHSSAAMDSALELIDTLRQCREFQQSLSKYHKMVAAKFFSKIVQNFTLRSRKALSYIRDGLSFFGAIPGEASPFFDPFFAELLNRIPMTSPFWVNARMRERFGDILKSRSINGAYRSRLFETAASMLRFQTAPLGQRFLAMLEFFRAFDDLQRMTKAGVSCKGVPLMADMFVAAGNPALLETLLFLDRVILGIEYSQYFGIAIREMWCKIMQAFWFIVADDEVLTRECRDAPID